VLIFPRTSGRWRTKIKTAMRAMVVVLIGEGSRRGQEMSSTENEEVVQTLAQSAQRTAM